jgi:hypothetical protein
MGQNQDANAPSLRSPPDFRLMKYLFDLTNDCLTGTPNETTFSIMTLTLKCLQNLSQIRKSLFP